MSEATKKWQEGYAKERPVGVVLDVGSGMVKAGFAGDDAPRAVFPTVIGRPRHLAAMVGMGEKDTYVGDEAQSQRGCLVLNYPMEHGHVTNWEDLESVYHHIFYNELRHYPEECPVLLSERVFGARREREVKAELLFENFEVPAVGSEPSGVLGLYASGTTSGFVLDVGDGVTSVTPVEWGHAITGAIRRIDIGSRDITHHLARLMSERNYRMDSSTEREMVRDVKEKLCYVAQDYEAEIQHAQRSDDGTKSYALPDERTVTLQNERFRAPEALFQPALLGRDSPGVVEIIADSLSHCPQDVRKNLIRNVIHIGGGTMFPGFADRVRRELAGLLPADNRPCMVAAPERKYMTWIGGSILASLHQYAGFTSRREYDEEGPGVVHRKCPVRC